MNHKIIAGKQPDTLLLETVDVFSTQPMQRVRRYRITAYTGNFYNANTPEVGCYTIDHWDPTCMRVADVNGRCCGQIRINRDPVETFDVDIPCPKVRKGIHTRWDGTRGRWMKLLRTGWYQIDQPPTVARLHV